MIDPKLNELAVDAPADADRLTAEEERAHRLKAGRSGLSINDTIARDANLSVGGRGVDVSGVRAGSGAGAGQTVTTPGERGESPAPNIVPGASGSGTTPRSTSGLTQNPAPSVDLSGGGGPTTDEISARAYKCWHERGCPDGSPEEDWHRARRELEEERLLARRRSASA